MKHTNYLMTIILSCLISWSANSQPVSTQDKFLQENSFGTSDWTSNGLEGKIYLLPEETQNLPDFDTMKSIGKIYTNEINIPNRSWTEGFPGITNRFEWFGIEYKGSFKVRKAGHYNFTLSSDDGSKLFIDGKLIIDNDGLHSQAAKSGEIDLDNSTHSIRIQYFQGPRTEIGLQLFVTASSDEQEVFPGKNFKLYTPKHLMMGLTMSSFILILLVLFILVFLFILRKTKRLRLLSVLIVCICTALTMKAQTPGIKNSNQKSIYVGAATTNRFNPSGINCTYTQPIAGRVGVSGDAGIYFGNNGPVNFNKMQLLGGINLQTTTASQGLSISPHVLLGITNIHSKYKFGEGSFSYNSLGPTISIGSDFSYPVNKHLSVVAKADYQPTLITGCINHDFRFGFGIKIDFTKEKKAENVDHNDVVSTEEKLVCKASKLTHEEKFDFEWLTKTIELAEKGLGKIPNIKAKFSLNPFISVKRGEECCSKDKPAAPYTELKGGVEASAKVEFVWGPFPNGELSLTIWPVKLKGELKCGIGFEPSIKLNIAPTGKFYGELASNPRPDCKSCVYVEVKLGLSGELNIQAKLAVGVYHWHIFGKGKAGFNTDGEPDENFEISAKAGVASSLTLTGRKVMLGDCVTPTPWHVKIDPLKAFLKFKVELGPLLWNPTFEVPLFDAYEADF